MSALAERNDRPVPDQRRRPTSTSGFGVGRRESHDASEFYARFSPPTLSDDDTVADPATVELADPFIVGDARAMHHLPDASVALVVTSPPYFVGKDYERDIARAEVPASYAEYLTMLAEVFEECVRVLEPGGRIAVNVANLGRKPYRSLSADVIDILQNRLGLLLRGEVIWQKGKGSTGSCAWGTFRSPANPVLRDLTERVVIASKGRFDRARSREERAAAGLPHRVTTTSDEFMEATLDVWQIEAESATRVGHPAPFPVELPARLIHLYTYQDDLVLDPFMGSGSTLVAAALAGRRYVGYDLDPAYAEISRARVHDVERGGDGPAAPSADGGHEVEPDGPTALRVASQARAADEGRRARDLAEQCLETAGFTVLHRNHRLRGLGLTVDFHVADAAGGEWYVDVAGGFTTVRPGLTRTDAVWRCLGRAAVLANQGYERVLFLTSSLPRRGSDGDRALRNATTRAFFDAVEIFSDADGARLRAYASGEVHEPLPGFWTERDLA
jgi:site-specific DNA-methyltransferase (adenine-specific)